MKRIGPVNIGKDTHIDDDVILGYPGKYHREMFKGEDPDRLPVTEIDDEVLLRDKTIIYADVHLGKGVQTGHHVLIREGCRIGDGTVVGSGCIIESDCEIGKNVSIQSGVYLASGTVIKDDVFLGPRVCMINDRMMDSNIEPVIVEKGSRIGANATIMAGVTIGESSLVGAGSVVTHSVKKGTKVYGVPAGERR